MEMDVQMTVAALLMGGTVLERQIRQSLCVPFAEMVNENCLSIVMSAIKQVKGALLIVLFKLGGFAISKMEEIFVKKNAEME